MDSPSAVSFYLPGETDLERLRTLDPDAEPEEFQVGERAWTLQTYLRLRQAGLPVRLTNVLPERGFVVFHARHKRDVHHLREQCSEVVLVALRGDRNPVLLADFEILQNPFHADGRRCFAVHHWPQPGLLPRDSRRGTALKVAVYKGFADNLDPGFVGEPWRRALAALEVDWVTDAAPFDRTGRRRYPVQWPSYQEVDTVVAVRRPDGSLHANKPATKLINAWMAGVPAILGPERAYRALRRGPLDYFEVSTVPEAVEAVSQLVHQPGLMTAMIENGRARATEFAPERLVSQWRDLLFETLPREAAARRSKGRPSLVALTAASWVDRMRARVAR